MNGMQRGCLTMVAAGLVVLLLGGCGGSKPTADKRPSPKGFVTNGVEKLEVKDAVEKAITASASAESVHAEGKMGGDGLQMQIDMRIKGDEGGAGFFINNGQRVDLIRLKTTVYFKGDKAFWTEMAGDTVAEAFAGKWVKTTTEDKDMAELASLTGAEQMFADGLDYGDDLPTKGKPQTVDGQLVLPLTDSDGQIAYVALTGKPRILKIASKDGTYSTTYTYDEPVTLKAPPASEVVDLDQ